MKTVIIIQARMSSSRLPGKVMKELSGKPLLFHVVERCRAAKSANTVVVATSEEKGDDVIAAFCETKHIPQYRGSLTNVLERYYKAALSYRADIIVRITADCPLVDPALIDLCLDAFSTSAADYASNVNPVRMVPRGLDVEVVSFTALEKAYRESKDPYDTEHVTPYIWKNSADIFTVAPSVPAPKGYWGDVRLALDYAEDYELMQKIYEEFYTEGSIIDVPSVIAWLGKHPRIRAMSATCESAHRAREGKEQEGGSVTLRRADERDSRFLFNLRNDESVRRVSARPDPISFETHSAWFRKKLSDKGSVIFIAEEKGAPIAQTRFDTGKGGVADISIAVVAAKRGKGYGSAIIKEATARFLKDHREVLFIRAFINAGNNASLRSFIKAGFESHGESDEGGLRRHLLVFPRDRH